MDKKYPVKGPDRTASQLSDFPQNFFLNRFLGEPHLNVFSVLFDGDDFRNYRRFHWEAQDDGFSHMRKPTIFMTLLLVFAIGAPAHAQLNFVEQFLKRYRPSASDNQIQVEIEKTLNPAVSAR